MAVKIKLKRLGKIRAPHYRIVVADSRTRRDGRAIEEIGLYHPVQNPSRIEVDSERAQYWLGVGAQPTEPVLAILKKTGDWQKFKGEPAPAPLLQPAEKAARPSFEALGGDDAGKGEAITQKKKSEKKDEAAAESSSSESTEA
ncbi:30S ribosomal protein S16 [Streptomyces pseudovenezuelae]|uniref:Small ribosomal subunit protein bS16 n=1 Tax=Streptomyces pseudovenezuelae TaxID=67350 RepID=A0A124H8S9_9ACTN|nr:MULTISPECIES: 30S ribosomal protein S16 [Streptomyces]KUM82818.1 30S ribosomal protein S16 [Streptomyces pseudovenezuelae]WUA88240.1 30S ribosomal protein S16 [Streptomyces pseudovenezuelae]